MAHLYRCRKRGCLIAAVAAAGTLLSGCGSRYVVLHPAGPVARDEFKLITLAASAMALVVAFVIALFVVTLVRFRDRPGNTAPYLPEWDGSKLLEVACFAIPVLIVAVIAVPTVRTTLALDRLPPQKDPLVIDVTSLDWKWLFEYPAQHVATVNYIKIPIRRPVLFELTADSPMNTFWVPQLGGMEFTMPGRVLPLWLEADRPGVYWGRSGNFSGRGFAHMLFHVDAVLPTAFTRWAARVHTTARPMSMADYKRLLEFNTVPAQTYSDYPSASFPSVTHGFSLEGGMYMETGLPQTQPALGRPSNTFSKGMG